MKNKQGYQFLPIIDTFLSNFSSSKTLFNSETRYGNVYSDSGKAMGRKGMWKTITLKSTVNSGIISYHGNGKS